MAFHNGQLEIENDDWNRFRSLERGLVVTIFFGKNKKPEKRTLQVKIETRQLVWIRAQGGKPEGSCKCFAFMIFLFHYFRSRN